MEFDLAHDDVVVFVVVNLNAFALAERDADEEV